MNNGRSKTLENYIKFIEAFEKGQDLKSSIRKKKIENNIEVIESEVNKEAEEITKTKLKDFDFVRKEEEDKKDGQETEYNKKLKLDW